MEKSSIEENSVKMILKNQSENIDFKLEHYKYILQEIHTLNENIHKFLILYQTLATAIIGGGIGIFVIWRNLKIDKETAVAAIQGSLVLLVLLTLFIILSIIANVLSWLDYRNEEVALLENTVKTNFRKRPTIRNFWRWSETYILLFMVIFVFFIWYYVENIIIPSVK